ncbi:putative Demethylmenaquinone methyltransferase [Stipitochalara longipes BDJ]|nr:putative Demethylmenaquinone methyltransferase [Stipitochalara longipes BDJ]
MTEEEEAKVKDESGGGALNAVDDSLPDALAVDDDSMNENEVLGDIEGDIERIRNHSTVRTVLRRSDIDTVNSTRTLCDSDIEYLMIHGRRYCGEYYMPIDEAEQSRGQMLHGVFRDIFNYRLTSVPLHNPKNILDIGTGTGEWSIEMGEQYPEAEVIGTDIARIQDTAVPENVYFQIDDAEHEDGWTFSAEFDLVHLRCMQGAFRSWQRVYSEAFKALAPGGYLEVIDFDNHTRILSYFSDDPGVAAWLAAVNEASKRSGRPRGDAHLNPELLREIGFVDVSVSEKSIPTGAWPMDPYEQNLGKHFLLTMFHGVEAMALRPLTENMDWSIEDVAKSIKLVEDRLWAVALDKEKSKGMGFIVKTLVGMKPLEDDIPEVDVPDEESIKTLTSLNGDIYIDK